MDDVTLKLCDQEETDTLMVVNEPPGQYNVFTPNQDGINDILFFSELTAAEDFVCMIFNRWGNLVFKNTDPLTGWKGEDDMNRMVSEGVYYYVVNARLKSGKDINKKGFIHLIR
jgi:gliding motility-associated-like protein